MNNNFILVKKIAKKKNYYHFFSILFINLFLFLFYQQKGVNYDKIWKDSYARYAESHKLLSNWISEDFNGIIIDDVLYSTSKDNTIDVSKGQTDIKNVQNNDKMVRII